MKTEVPEGYRRDARGALIPVENIKEIDLLRDEIVLEIVARVRAHSEALAELKAALFDDIEAFVSLSADKYGIQVGGKKGNIQLLSFDGRYKVLRCMAEHIVFDERLQIAKELIDSCLHRWTEGARSEIRALIDQAFQVDKAGKISTGRVLGLRTLKIDDPQWLEAMQAIADSLAVVGSKAYVRVYEQVEGKDEYRPIPLDIAAL